MSFSNNQTVLSFTVSSSHSYNQERRCYVFAASNPPKRFVWLQHNSTFVSVDLSKENWFQFNCSATSDPCTPVTVQWYKMVDQGGEESVYSESPYLSVVNGTLTLRTEANCSDTCYKYLGEYKCVADNNYTQDNVTVMLTGRHYLQRWFHGQAYMYVQWCYTCNTSHLYMYLFMDLYRSL